ncbi:hypothetical protein [Litoribacter populi]|uniref:hypothetical protein n=1 Tax=Litoribacter populi TaxID=2598460 RepID=UPI00117DDC8E|nr:hypothetical protein [Litoribacter populi]
MNKIIYLFALIGLIFTACNNDDEVPAGVTIEGEWRISRVDYQGFPEDFDEEDEEFWETTYVFGTDNRFTKITNRPGAGGEASGTYSRTQPDSELDLDEVEGYYSLSFETGGEIVESCGSQTAEIFTLMHTGELINELAPCDGPNLYYTKVN